MRLPQRESSQDCLLFIFFTFGFASGAGVNAHVNSRRDACGFSNAGVGKNTSRPVRRETLTGRDGARTRRDDGVALLESLECVHKLRRRTVTCKSASGVFSERAASGGITNDGVSFAESGHVTERNFKQRRAFDDVDAVATFGIFRNV